MEMKVFFIAILFFSSSVLFFGSNLSFAKGDNGGGDDDGDGGAPVTPSSSTPCASQLKVSSKDIPFLNTTSSFSCNKAWSSQGFTLMFQQTEANLWTFILTAPDNNAYISVGFSPSGRMVGSSAIAGWIPSGGGAGIVRQYYLGGTSSSQCPPDQGSLKLGKAATVSLSGQLYMAFQLNTTNPGTNLIYAVGPQGSLPGSGYLLPQHSSTAATTIDYTTGQNSPSTSSGSTTNTDTKTSSACSAKLTVSSNSIPFDTTGFGCYNAWSAQDFTLFYKNNGSNLWSFVLSAPDNNAYISIGFSPNGNMVGTSAIAGWVSGGTSGTAKQYYLGGTSSGNCPADQGSLQLVLNKAYIVSESSRLYLAFQLRTSQPGSNLIYAVGPKGTFPSSNNLLPTHQDKTSTYLNYATGQSSASGSGASTLKRAHGFMAIFGWGVLMPIGVVMARYFKHRDPLWFYSHISIQGLGFLFGILSLLTGFALQDKVGNVDTHKGIGIFIMVLGCLQVLAFLARPDKAAKIRRYWNWYHHNVGRIAIAFAVVNIFYGLSLGHEDQSWSIGYGVFLGVWILACVVLEARMRLFNRDI